LKNKNILITGSSGFIGSFLVEGALDKGFTTWAGVRKTSSKQYLQNSSIQFIEIDLASYEELRKSLKKHKETHGVFDVIIHCAGVTQCKNKKEFYHINYEQTKSFIETLIELDMTPKQFVFISTLSVFGPIKEACYTPIRESDTPQPNTAYGLSKLKTEQYIQSIADFPYTIFRPTGVYGPREKDYYMMAKSIKNHLDFSVGYKPQKLTFVYVKDLVNAVFLAISKEKTQRTYFATDGKVYTSRTFSDLIQKELGISFLVRIKCPLFILKVISLSAEFFSKCLGRSSTLNSDKYKIMKQRNWKCDQTPTIEELGYQPQYDLSKGVKETIDWYKKEQWL